MASALTPSTDHTYFHVLEQALRNSNLSDQERQQLWMQAASALPSNVSNTNSHPSLARQVPRSMSTQLVPTITHTTTPEVNPMDRTQSAPAFVHMERSLSSLPAHHNNNSGSIPQQSICSTPSWPSPAEDNSSSYTLCSQSSLLRKQPSLPTINEMATFSNNGTVEYDPAEYISSCMQSSSSPFLPLPRHHHADRLQVQLTQDSQWSPSLMDGSISPSTPSTTLMTPVTIADSNMSRQSSFNPQFFDNTMSRVHSDSSSLFQPILPEDGSISFSFNPVAKDISSCVDTSVLSTFTGISSEDFPSATVSSSASALGSSQHESYLVEDMRRSTSQASSSDESSTSNASASSTSTRHSRRDRDIALASRVKIAPKAVDGNDETKSASSNVQMRRVLSEDGSSKDVAPITKAPYIRPQHPRIMCKHCNARPEGFRGSHELDRHVARAHATIRKGYVCVDFWSDKKFLANCKHCRNKKVYGAYYNAAAHLRRTHFHPRKRGRKGKHDEKRGGIGGGDDPSMEWLKQHWIEEIEISGDVKRGKKATPESSPYSNDDSDNPLDASNNEPFECDAIDAAYAQPVPTADLPNMSEYSQYMDQNVFVTSNDGSFDALTQFNTYADPDSATQDIDNFRFDADYM